MYTKIRLFLLLGAALFVLTVLPYTVSASHSWGNYHWARTSNPFNLNFGDNLSPDWDSYLATASSDWSKSRVLDTTIVGGGANPRCRGLITLGRVEVCNAWYGNIGWIGVAGIAVSGNHIVAGIAIMNDYYFSLPRYNTTAWKNLVMCQEVGHTFGLDHQDENFDNEPLKTCMDYSRDPEPNQHPNRHDYEQLEIIYEHLDSTTTVGALPAEMTNVNFGEPSQWGQLIRNNGATALYERDFGNGNKLFTFVFWA